MNRQLLDWVEPQEDHPHSIVEASERGNIVAMDSARYVDERNRGRDVVVAASYLGVLPARLMAPHHPRGVIGHDGCIGKDGSGIAGLGYLEALGIPAATADGMSAELGNGLDMWQTGRISRMNILAEQCGVRLGMSVQDAAHLLKDRDPGNVEPGTRVRREIMERSPSGRAVVVTDSIVFALPEDRGRNVLVTAGHTGRSGASFVKEFAPWGFISSDGGRAKNDSGIAGLWIAQEAGFAGATVDGRSAVIGDGFSTYYDGIISACNRLAEAAGVRIGQPAREAAQHLLQERPEPQVLVSVPAGGTMTISSTHNAVHAELASPLLQSGELRALSPKFAEGLARVRDVTDRDGALSAASKALLMAAAACVKLHADMMDRALQRAHTLGVPLQHARGASIALLISRGEAIYESFARAVDRIWGDQIQTDHLSPTPEFENSTADAAKAYFQSYFGLVPEYINIMADASPRGLEGYFLMREASLAENTLPSKDVELLLVAVNAAEYQPRFIGIHAAAARKKGATQEELAEACICALPVAGVATWLPAADGIAPPTT